MRRAREPLLQCLHAVIAQRFELWPQLLASTAADHAQSWRWNGLLTEEPAVAAVRVAHAIDMGPPGLQGWYAQWPSLIEPAALQFAASAAGLLAGCEPLAAAGIGDRWLQRRYWRAHRWRVVRAHERRGF